MKQYIGVILLLAGMMSLNPKPANKVEANQPIVSSVNSVLSKTLVEDKESKLTFDLTESEFEKQEREKKELSNKVSKREVIPRSSLKRVEVSGNCSDWIAQAGISDVASANEIIRRESSCNPSVKNKISGACGVAQELPCGKSGCSLGDGACQVAWMNQYVLDRYGSWSSAVAFHDIHHWY